jgi:LEA14-like dessication related protein
MRGAALSLSRERAKCVLAASLLLGGCVLTAKLTPPTLSVVNVQLNGSDLWEQHLKVRMHVQNPNDRTLPIRAITYTLEVEGELLASGESAASFVVPARGEAEFDMNVTTNLAGTLLKLIGRGSGALSQPVAYRLTGKVSLSQGLMRSIPFDEHGEFRLQ